MSIEVSNLLKVYDEQKAVNNVSFSVKKGEIVGFLGPNGAGKSTTMKIITGYLPQTGGSAKVCDIDVSEDPIAVKKKIGYLAELNALYYDMFVREYLGFIAELHELKDKKKAIESVLETVGLTAEANKKIGQLSKGYKQRVGLAAALIHDPEVLILDEPTSGLDPNQIIEIRQVIKQQGQNKTVLFSSHILQEVEALCDRVIIINKGELVADELLSILRSGNRNQHVVTINFTEPVKTDQLETIGHVTRLDQLSDKSFRLTTDQPERVRKQLLEFSVNQNLNIVSLQSDQHSLEDIFRLLTNKK